MMQLIRGLLQNCIDRIDAGNSNIDADEMIEVVEILKKYTSKDKKLSKCQACKKLNMSRATFDRYVKEGKIPQGKKEVGFKELFWSEDTLNAIIMQYKK